MGAGALAGLINLTSLKPDDDLSVEASIGTESYGGNRAALSINGPISEDLNARLAHQEYRSDGWLKNSYLGRKDTNARDEGTTRLAVQYQADKQQVDLGLHRIDINNGYDAFSLDNTRTTLSDEPGSDSLDFLASRLAWQYLNGSLNHGLQLSRVSADSVYSYDEDWSFVGIAPGWEYRSVDAYLRDIDRTTLEWRTAGSSEGANWVTGVYLRQDQEKLTRNYTYLSEPFTSDNEADTQAVFGQLDYLLAPTITVFMGARFEQRELNYSDSNGVNQRLDKNYWTGHLGTEWTVSNDHRVFASLSRGLRAGGVNASLASSLTALADEFDVSPYQGARFFDAESLVNLEFGWRFENSDSTLSSSLTAFDMSRDDQQVKGSLVIQREDSTYSFTDFTDNAASGSNRGLEWTLDWQASEALDVALMLSTLDASFDSYIDVEGNNLSGRDQPQAPDWQYSAAVQWKATPELTTRIEITGRDSYFLSDRHDLKSPSVTLLNAQVEWQANQWSLALWARNLTNEETITRGFGTFGNDPRKEYVTEPYYQYGEPSVIGLTLNYRYGG